MSESAPSSVRRLESFRSYLRMLAVRSGLGILRGQVDPSDVVQNTLLKGDEHFGQYRGNTEAELGVARRNPGQCDD